MNQIENYLLDKDFLEALNKHRIRETKAQLLVLNYQDTPINYIEGVVTSGSISVDGSSSVRRTLNLSMLFSEDWSNLTDINNLISPNKKVRCLIGIKNPFMQDLSRGWSDYGEWIWQKMGDYFITSASSSVNASGAWSISIKAVDKMAMLNGTLGGTLPAATVFHEQLEVQDNGDLVVAYPRIYDIIYELVHHFGAENPSKIMISDIPLTGRLILYYAGMDRPLYISKGTGTESTHFCWEPDDPAAYFPVLYGQKIGYESTPLEYPGELCFNSGATVTQVLDEIVKVLGNYTYYYDLEGNFRFEYLNKYNQTGSAPVVVDILNANQLERWLPFYSETDFITEFKNTDTMVSISINPDYSKIKNDFIVWGQVGDDEKGQVRYHLAIDQKPYLVTGVDSTTGTAAPTLPQVDEETHEFNYNDAVFNSLSSMFIWEVKKVLNINDGVPIDAYGYTSGTTKGYTQKVLGKVLRYVFTKNNVNTPTSITLATDEAVDLTTSPHPPTVGTYTAFIGNYNYFDYREELYRRALLAWNYSIKSSEYDEELIAEWRLIYDPRSTQFYNANDTTENKQNVNYGNNLGYDSFQYRWNNQKVIWEHLYEITGTYSTNDIYNNLNTTWAGYNPDVIESPEKIRYWLDILDINGPLGKYSISKIGKRSVNVTNNKVDSIFKVNVPDLVWMVTNDAGTQIEDALGYEELKSINQPVSAFLPEDRPYFKWASYYGSCFETMRQLLFDNLKFNTQVTITAIPRYYLEPNKMIYLNFPQLGLSDYFIIDKISYTLAYNGTMQVTAHQAEIIA